uniref:hypothetical protein n=1 Tax=Parerythrobacter lutipelagi TaxID=1964208 RepID=UPI0010F62104|nr:hypothetical protein [Parerythrobacter lutipelagi]
MKVAHSGFDLSEIRFVKRIGVGNLDIRAGAAEPSNDAAMQTLNRCLSEYPRGTIIGREMSFDVLTTKSGHQVVLEKVTYHVGFPRKPAWLDEEPQQQADPAEAALGALA